MELQTEPLNGVGITLSVLETVLRDTMLITTAEIRYDARQKPVRVRLNYKTNEFVITETSLDKDGLILTIDPVF
jgi:hypothetical protein